MLYKQSGLTFHPPTEIMSITALPALHLSYWVLLWRN